MLELHDAGLDHDFPMLRRRRLLGLAGGTTVAALAYQADMMASSRASQPSAGDSPPAFAGVSSRADVLTCSGIVRSDIRRSFGMANGVAKGVPLTIKVQLVSANSGKPVAGHAVYLWHCDRDGNYSLYAGGLMGENYLRGVQASDATGWVEFTSIYPGAYDGRWPHLHFEVYPCIAAATSAQNKLHTSRLTLPADASRTVYATPGYRTGQKYGSPSTRTIQKNVSQPGFADNNGLKDGRPLEMASVTGDVQRGFVATRTVAV